MCRLLFLGQAMQYIATTKGCSVVGGIPLSEISMLNPEYGKVLNRELPLNGSYVTRIQISHNVGCGVVGGIPLSEISISDPEYKKSLIGHFPGMDLM